MRKLGFTLVAALAFSVSAFANNAMIRLTLLENGMVLLTKQN